MFVNLVRETKRVGGPAGPRSDRHPCAVLFDIPWLDFGDVQELADSRDLFAVAPLDPNLRKNNDVRIVVHVDGQDRADGVQTFANLGIIEAGTITIPARSWRPRRSSRRRRPIVSTAG